MIASPGVLLLPGIGSGVDQWVLCIVPDLHNLPARLVYCIFSIVVYLNISYAGFNCIRPLFSIVLLSAFFSGSFTGT